MLHRPNIHQLINDILFRIHYSNLNLIINTQILMGNANFMNSKSLTTKRLRSTYMSMLQKYLHFQGNATFI